LAIWQPGWRASARESSYPPRMALSSHDFTVMQPRVFPSSVPASCSYSGGASPPLWAPQRSPTKAHIRHIQGSHNATHYSESGTSLRTRGSGTRTIQWTIYFLRFLCPLSPGCPFLPIISHAPNFQPHSDRRGFLGIPLSGARPLARCARWAGDGSALALQAQQLRLSARR
jgi:hypothetical protein